MAFKLVYLMQHGKRKVVEIIGDRHPIEVYGTRLLDQSRYPGYLVRDRRRRNDNRECERRRRQIAVGQIKREITMLRT